MEKGKKDPLSTTLPEYLEKVFTSGTQSQFYIFSAEGSLDRAIAIALCDNHHACEKCQSCSLRKSNNHPDLFYIEGDAQHIKDEDVEEIFSFIITEGPTNKKVIAIKDAEKLTTKAQNRLLKMLEQPKENLYFFFETQHPQMLLETILSRAVLIHFPLETEPKREQSKSLEGEEEKSIQLATYLMQRKYTEANKNIAEIKKDKRAITTRLVQTSSYLRTYMNTLIVEDSKKNQPSIEHIMNTLVRLDTTIRNIDFSGNIDLNIDRLIYTQN